MTSEAISWTIEAEIKDGMRAQLEQLLAAATEAVQPNEPATTVYEFYVDDDGGTFRGIESYTSSEAALAHLAAMGPQLGPLVECFGGAPTVVVFGTPSKELREAMAGFQPKYATRIAGFRR